MLYQEKLDYFNSLGTVASRFSKLRNSDYVTRKGGRTEAYMLTFQNNEEGNKLCEDFKNLLKLNKGFRFDKKGRHSDRQGLADKGLASREWIGGNRHVRDVPYKHSEYFDLYVRKVYQH